MSSELNRGDYYSRMIFRAFEVVQKKHSLPPDWPEQGFMAWVETAEPDLFKKFNECDRAVEEIWDEPRVDGFKQRTISLGKVVIEILEKRHAWELSQKKAPHQPHTFKPVEPAQGKLL